VKSNGKNVSTNHVKLVNLLFSEGCENWAQNYLKMFSLKGATFKYKILMKFDQVLSKCYLQNVTNFTILGILKNN